MRNKVDRLRARVWNLGARSLSVTLASLLVVGAVVSQTPQEARAASPTITIPTLSAAVGEKKQFTIALDSNFTAASYLAVVSASSGTLELSGKKGLTATGKYTLGPAQEIGFSGTLADISAALTGMYFTGASAGSVTISATISELGVVSVGGGPASSGALYVNPVTGHYYEYVDNSSNISWTAARAAAEKRSLFGLTGYLATLTTESENRFVAEKMTASDIWIGASDATTEGQWRWETGPEAGTIFWQHTCVATNTCTDGSSYGPVSDVIAGAPYSSWAGGEPNNGGSEDYAVTNWSSSTGNWNDLADGYSVSKFLVEYGGIGTSTAQSASGTGTIVVGGPGISSLSPASGTNEGGTFVTVTGSGFTNAAGASIISGVTVGGVAASKIDNVTATSFSMFTPAGPVGAAPVVVTTSVSSSTDVVSFTYEDPSTVTFPAITAITPASGSVAGGTSVTVTGTGFIAGAKVVIDGVELVTTVTNPTTLTATTPVRSGSNESLTVGAKPVQVRIPVTGADFAGGYRASGEEVYFTYAPNLINPNTGPDAFKPGRVQLGAVLADRTQAKPLTRSGASAPYIMSGFLGPRVTGKVDTAADYVGRGTYSYTTDSTYSSSPSGNGREGWEITDPTDIDSQSYSASLDSVGKADESWKLTSNLNCGNFDNTPGNGVTAYCTIFGPQLLSEPFYATTGQSISFSWKAQNGGDDYEVYAYLVKVTDSADLTFADADHTTILHSRGRSTSFITSAANIPESGLYRFRFVNGSFDASGGQALGAQMYVKTSVVLGKSNEINFPEIGNRLRGDADPFSVTVSASSGQEVEVSASGACEATTSHSGTTTTVQVSRTSSTTTCTLTASQGQVGVYAPAASVTRSFTYPAVTTPGAPTDLEATPSGGQVSIAFSEPADNGGIAVTNYQYKIGDGSWVTRSPASTATPLVISGLTNGQRYSVRIRAVNAQGSGAESSAVTFTVVDKPGAPTVLVAITGTDRTSVAFTVPASDGGSAITNYEYSVDGGTTWVALNPVSTASPAVITGLREGTTYVVLLRALNSVGSGDASEPVSVTTQSTPRPRPTPPTVLPDLPPGSLNIFTQRTTFSTPTNLPPMPGPVTSSIPPTSLTGPQGTVGGTPTPSQTSSLGTTGVRVTTGPIDFGLRVNSADQGRIVTNPSGNPELVVVNGQTTLLSGTGARPGSFVQVFLPFDGTNAVELARVPVDQNGVFNGQAAFQAGSTPLPIGRHVLQVVSYDEDGNQVVVDMPINVAQPPPQPEPTADGEIPDLNPGESLATRAGQPVSVNVIPVPDNKQTIIEGDDWTMEIQADGEGSNVQENADGEVLINFTRDEAATVSGDGFMPGTRADVWLYSTPTLLGTVDIDENGQFNGQVMVDGKVVEVGEHTLQLQGVGMDGYVRAANLGVVVNDEAIATTAAVSLAWVWWLIALLFLTATIGLFWWLWRRGQEA